jgi:transcriptional regulator with AAA-type ATPase domain
LLELAGEGTVFLDEIADLPLPMQAKFLQVLQGANSAGRRDDLNSFALPGNLGDQSERGRVA